MATQQYKTIAVDCLCDLTAVPTVLLENYRAFNLREGELVFLLQLLRLKSHGAELELDAIAEAGEYDYDEVKGLACALVEKGFMTLSGETPELAPLFDKLKEGWGWRKQRSLNKAPSVKTPPAADQQASFGLLYAEFEQEMGRPLSAMEGEKLKDWFETLALPPELIREALKRAVLNGVYTFSYIDKILNGWHKKRFRSLNDVAREDEAHEQKKAKKSVGGSSNGNSRVKYRDDQEESPAVEIYEV